MQKVHCPTDVTNLAVLGLIKLRFDQLENVIDDTTFFVVEPGDTVEAMETETGCPIVTSWFSNDVFGDTDFIPSFDFIEEHKQCYEMMFNTTDDATVVIMIPKAQNLDARLLALCQQYA